MNIEKRTRTLKTTPEDLAAVNALTRRELGEEELYLFSLCLCDNDIDRDGERFTTETLEALAPMFVGRSGIFDHQWSARGQTARLYKCEVVREPGRVNQAGESYCWLKGYAYMLRSEANGQLIDEIDAGIKKEVSIGCSVARKTCSVCGADVTREGCGHRKGERYEGQLCWVNLEGALDAYEFSFVAVPAQPAAGVVKGMSGPDISWKELEKLREEAALGRAYLKQLKEEVVRLGLLAGMGLEAKQLRDVADTLFPHQLEQLKTAYGRQARINYPISTQFSYGEREERRGQDEAFMI